MPLSVRSSLAPLALLLAASGLAAQSPPGAAERPVPFVPKTPATRAELDRVEVVKLYGLAILQERDNRLLEAVRTLEEARRLDPEAHAVHQALIPLYLAIDRVEDALACCERALDLDPDDYDTGYLYARQLRMLDRLRDALEVLKKAAASPGLKEHLDVRAQVFFDMGVLYENTGDWEHAEAAFREVAGILDQPAALLEQVQLSREEINTQAAETYERLGRTCLKGGRREKAIAAFEQARKKDPDRAARLAYNLAEVLVGEGKSAEALRCLNEYLRTQPQGMEAYELKIRLLKKLGRDADIVPELRDSSGHDPHNMALKLLLAREVRLAGGPAEAEEIYNKVIGESPSPEAFRGLFELYKEDGRRGAERALQKLDAAVQNAVPKDDKAAGDAAEAAKARAMLLVLREDADLVKRLLPAAHRRLEQGDPPAYQTRMLLAALAARTRQLDAAEELYRSCLDRPGGPRGVEQEVYAGLLRVLWLAHKHEAILEVCARGLKDAQATNRVMFHYDLARAQMALNRPKEALAAADAAVNEAGDKERLQCRQVRVEVLSQSERHKEAVAECAALLKEYNQPGDVRDIRATLANVYSAARDYAKSEEQLRLILKEDPNDATANNDLGYQWADQNKNLAEAERMIRKALDLDRKQRTGATALGLDSDRDNAAYVDSLGWVLFRRGKPAQARKELEKAAALPGGSDDPVVWDHLGDVCLHLEDTAKAKEAWKKALGLYESGGRRRIDDRYKEIKAKLGLTELEP